MKILNFKKCLMVSFCVGLFGIAQAQSTSQEYASYQDFKSNLLNYVTQHGQPQKASAAPTALPSSEQGLENWLRWGPTFISDEPEKCAASSPSFEYTYERIDGVGDSDVETCFSINAAKRNRSTTDGTACDQSNGRYFACF